MSLAASRDPGATMSTRFVPSPLVFEPILEARVWGGRGLERYGKQLPPGAKIGESWEISDIPRKASAVAAGSLRGITLAELVGQFPRELLGPRAVAATGAVRRFPLLFKLLEASQHLSVQVHPSDADLRRRAQDGWGKTEAWVILEAAPGARIVAGITSDVPRGELFRRLRALGGAPLPPAAEAGLFRWVDVHRGDVVFVPAGTVHAVGAGIVLLEVQQTSDITYRLYDWGRPGEDGRPRALHLDEAEDVSPAPEGPCPCARIARCEPARDFVSLLACPHFRIELLTLGPATPNGPGFAATTAPAPELAEPHVLTMLEGTATLASAREEPLSIAPGRLVLLPAALGEYRLRANAATRLLRFRLG